MKSSNSVTKNKNQQTDPPTCPKCRQPLTTIRYTEYGGKTWSAKGWQESDTTDADWRAGCCDIELNYDDLQKLGVF
jgi:hypothetical protein